MSWTDVRRRIVFGRKFKQNSANTLYSVLGNRDDRVLQQKTRRIKYLNGKNFFKGIRLTAEFKQ